MTMKRRDYAKAAISEKHTANLRAAQALFELKAAKDKFALETKGYEAKIADRDVLIASLNEQVESLASTGG